MLTTYVVLLCFSMMLTDCCFTSTMRRCYDAFAAQSFCMFCMMLCTLLACFAVLLSC